MESWPAQGVSQSIIGWGAAGRCPAWGFIGRLSRAVALLEAAKERLQALLGMRRCWARERVSGPGQVTGGAALLPRDELRLMARAIELDGGWLLLLAPSTMSLVRKR